MNILTIEIQIVKYVESLPVWECGLKQNMLLKQLRHLLSHSLFRIWSKPDSRTS